MKPDRKIQAGGVAGMLSTILVWLVGQFDVELPPEVAVAAATLIIFAASYFVPNPPREGQ